MVLLFSWLTILQEVTTKEQGTKATRQQTCLEDSTERSESNPGRSLGTIDLKETSVWKTVPFPLRKNQQDNKTIYLFVHNIDYEVEFIYMHPCSNNDVRVWAKQQYRKRQVWLWLYADCPARQFIVWYISRYEWRQLLPPREISFPIISKKTTAMK